VAPLPSSPGLGDWLASLARAFHPLRWLLCLAGLVFTGLSAVALLSLFDREIPTWTTLWWQSDEVVASLFAEVRDRKSLGARLLGCALLVINASLWSLLGGWIARDELLARQRDRFETRGILPRPGPTALVVGHARSLLLTCPRVLLIALLMLVPGWIAGWVNALPGGVGAVIVALLLPVVLGTNLVFLVVVVGGPAWPLMPVAVAAQCADTFEALSRSYSYVCQRPLSFLLLMAVALSVAGLPLAALCYPLAEAMEVLKPQTRQGVLWVASAISVSIFWSLVTLVYLHLRASLDNVNVNEVAIAPVAPVSRTTAPSSRPDQPEVSGDANTPGLQNRAVSVVRMLTFCASSWLFTAWLLGHVGGESTWLDWGVIGPNDSPVVGLYRVASMIARGWLALILLVAGYRLLRRG
jgi:hypothetical protein